MIFSTRIVVAFLLFLPSHLFAKDTSDDLTKAIFEGLISPLLGLTATGLLAYYIFIIAKYMWDKDQNENSRIALRKHLVWGGFGLFLVFSLGGLYALISSFVPEF